MHFVISVQRGFIRRRQCVWLLKTFVFCFAQTRRGRMWRRGRSWTWRTRRCYIANDCFLMTGQWRCRWRIELFLWYFEIFQCACGLGSRIAHKHVEFVISIFRIRNGMIGFTRYEQIILAIAHFSRCLCMLVRRLFVWLLFMLTIRFIHWRFGVRLNRVVYGRFEFELVDCALQRVYLVH